jgi:helicase
MIGWLLSALTELCDLRCFYFHLQQESGADEGRVREIKRLFQRLRLLAFDALGRLKCCSPLGPLLTQMRRGAGSRGVGINTIRKLESLGVESLTRLAKMSGNDFKNAGIKPAIAKRIESYVRRRLA